MQLTPDGDVWACCVKSEVLGNLRESGYDFKKYGFPNKQFSLEGQLKTGNASVHLPMQVTLNMLFPLKPCSSRHRGAVEEMKLVTRRHGIYWEPSGGKAGQGRLSCHCPCTQREQHEIPASGSVEIRRLIFLTRRMLTDC